MVSMRTELQVRVNLTFDRIVCNFITASEKDVLKAASNSEKYYWKRRQKE